MRNWFARNLGFIVCGLFALGCKCVFNLNLLQAFGISIIVFSIVITAIWIKEEGYLID